MQLKKKNDNNNNNLQIQTGCPKQEKTIPPIAAETMTTTKSEINLPECKAELIRHKSKAVHKSN